MSSFIDCSLSVLCETGKVTIKHSNNQIDDLYDYVVEAIKGFTVFGSLVVANNNMMGEIFNDNFRKAQKLNSLKLDQLRLELSSKATSQDYFSLRSSLSLVEDEVEEKSKQIQTERITMQKFKNEIDRKVSEVMSTQNFLQKELRRIDSKIKSIDAFKIDYDLERKHQ